MPTQVQFRRGTTAQNNSFIGAVGEVSIDTDKDALRIHDGTTSGGFEQAKVDLTNVSGATNLSLSGITTTNSLSIGSTQVISSARQLQNIASLDATTTATIESAVAAAPNNFTSLNISGVSTFSGITTHTTSLFGTQASFSGVITATTFVGAITGAVTGTATSTTNIPNLTGAITSNNTTTSLGSFTSAQLATALTDETGSGANVFATSPTLVTPVLGAASATSINSSGIITASTFSGNLANTLTLATSGTGLSGSTTFNNSAASTFTVTSNATSNNTNSTIVARDASGNFSAGTITASLTGTASSTTNIPNLTGDITSVNSVTSIAAGVIIDADINASAGIVDTKLATIATALKVSNSATTATNANTASAIVARDASGNFSAGTITASLTGTATSTTNIPNLTGAITSVNTTTSLGSFTSLQLLTALSDETGTGANVFATSPTLVTPVLGTPSSGTLTNCTSLPISGLTASTSTALGVGSIELGHATDTTLARGGAGVVTIEGVNVVTTSSTDTLTNKTLTSPTLTTPALGTPSSGTLTSCTGLPVSTGISGLAANVATFLATPSSANLISALTDETGSGAAVFATSPTLVTPVLGAATATSIVVGSGVTINASGINASGIVTASQLSTGASGTGINITTNTISGPATLTIDPAGVGDNTGAVRIKGDLFVDGTQFVVNSTTIELADLNVGIATTVGTNALLDGAGIGIGSANIRKTLQWENSTSSLKSSEDFNLGSGKSYQINGSSVLNATTLGGAVVASSLTSVGTLTNLNVGNVNSSGIITATTFVGALTGTATSTTNIPNLTGDVTSVNKATTLATANSNVGTFGSGGSIPTITGNAKGLVTGVTTTAVNPANDGTLTLAVSGTGLSGSASFTANQSGASSFTVTSNATNANTASAIVARDASGNFSAGTITASLTGTASNVTTNANLTGHVTSVGNAAVLGSFTSAQLATALTDETGTGANVFATSPTLVTPALGTPSSGTLTSCTGLPLTTGVTGTLPVANGGTGVTASTGTGSVVLSTSPTLVTPVLGAATATSIVVGSGVTINASGINAAAGIVTATTFVGNLTNTLTLATSGTGLSGSTTFNNSAASTFTVTSNATNANTASAIVARDASGNFSAGTITASLTGTASNVTTNANLTGHVTSVGNAAVLGSFTSLQLLTALTDETGTGAAVFATSPTLVTPVLGTPSSGTLTSCTGLPVSTGISGLAANVATFLATPSSANLISALTDETGSGSNVFATSPTLVTPVLGTPSSGTLTSCTGLPISTGVAGLAANVATFLATPSSANFAAALTDETGSGANVFATSPTLVTPVLGAASATSIVVGSGVTINASGIVASAGIITATTFVGALTGTASNVTTNANLTGHVTSVGNAAVLGSFTSAQLATALTDETGSGANVFATSPTLVTPVLGTPSSGTLTNCTFPTLNQNTTGNAATVTTNANLTGHVTSVGNAAVLGSFTSLQLLTALTDETGTGANVFATSPTLVTPALGTPSSGTLTSCTGLPLTTGVTGTLPVANGGTGITALGTGVATFLATPSSANLAAALTDETGSGSAVFATSPTLVTPVLGTPSSGTLTSCTGLPISGLTASTSTALGVGSIELGHATDTTLARSAAGVVTIEGVEVVTLSRTQTLTNKTLTSPIFGSGVTHNGATSGSTILQASAIASGTLTLPAATDTLIGKATTDTLTNKTLTSPTLTTPALGTPSSGTLTSCTGLPLTTGVTGTLPVANGGTGVTASTGTGSVVLSASPTFTGTVGAAAITATGDISAANFNSTSDISLKGNIQTIVDPLDKINKLNGVTFNWKENQKPSIGVIAQELEKVLPELVTQGDVKSVNYNGLIGVLIEAVKEQQKQIEELKDLVKDLTTPQ